MALLRSGSVAATPVAGGMLLVRITSSPKFSSCLARTSIHSLGSEASSFAFSSAALFTGASSKLFGASVSSSSKPVAVTRIVASRGRRAAGLGLLSFAVGVNLSSRALAAEVAEKSVYDHIVKVCCSISLSLCFSLSFYICSALQFQVNRSRESSKKGAKASDVREACHQLHCLLLVFYFPPILIEAFSICPFFLSRGV